MSTVSSLNPSLAYAAQFTFQQLRREPGNQQPGSGEARSAQTVSAPPPVQAGAPAGDEATQADAAYLSRYGGVLRAVAGLPLPFRADGAQPLVTPDQQALIDRIAAKYAESRDIPGLMRELWANGVHPTQIAEKADVWVLPNGRTVGANGNRVSQALNVSA